MITLNTLHEATAQQVFDQVAKHLLTQGERAVDLDSGYCMYRTTTGLRCAAGCLISDDEYTEDIELSEWSNLVDADAVPADHDELILALQDLHDNTHHDDWADVLAKVANEFNLPVSRELNMAMQSYIGKRNDDKEVNEVGT